MAKLDHLPFGVRDVDRIRDDLQRIGFTTTEIGVCRWSQRDRAYEARSASVVFEHAYLDLIEVRDPTWDSHLRAAEVYAKGIAPSGIVLSSRGASLALEEARARLSAGGIDVGEPYEIRRELPGANPREIRYRIFSLRGPALPFAFIEDSAPEAMRTERWLRHSNSVTGIRSIHLRVPSLQTTGILFASIFGEGSAAADAVEFDLGEAALIAHEAPLDGHLDAVSRMLPRPDRASLLAIEFGVADADSTRKLLARNHVPSRELAGGIAVEPSAGYGCGIVFVPER